MPELPEVEVVKRSLQKNIKNLTIKKVKIHNIKLRYIINKNQINKITNKKILNIKRRSKYLIINLSKGISIISHLGMTGKFIILKKKTLKKTSFYYDLKNLNEKHNHLVFFLDKKIKLIYNDVRKFGFIKIVKTDLIDSNSHIKRLGPEPLSSKFDFIYFKKIFLIKRNLLKIF